MCVHTSHLDIIVKSIKGLLSDALASIFISPNSFINMITICYYAENISNTTL